ncbi:MAG: class aldolase [Rhodospirillales bacterium]|jgi:ribulose-5-phosphate 4-epimerase/fuculose-1-phosphate aldolase|nr:class aldolase [Rhodospirillales bacterium]
MVTYTNVLPMSQLRTRNSIADTERELRVELAAAYRIFDYLGWTSQIYGHITMRLPGPERHFLINPFGLRYDEVTASNLVKIDLDGNIVEPSEYPVNFAGFIIHGAIHAVREDAHCIMHTHTQAGMVMAALKDPIRPLDFSGAALHKRVAYHDFQGVHADYSDREALVADLGDKNMMVLRNHGLLACGRTVASAYQRLFTMETACKVQAAALALNVPLNDVPPEVAEKHANALNGGEGGELAFAAMVRLMEKRDPSYLE